MIPDLDKMVALAYHATDAPLTLSENLGLRLLQHYGIDDNLQTTTGMYFSNTKSKRGNFIIN